MNKQLFVNTLMSLNWYDWYYNGLKRVLERKVINHYCSKVVHDGNY